MKNLSVRLARIYFWTEKALLGALLALFLTALVLQLLENILPDAVMMKLGPYALYLTLPLGMIFVPGWLADWRFGWFKRSLLAGLITAALVEGLGLYHRLTPNEVWLYMVLLVPSVMAVWPIFGLYFKPFQAAPAPEAPPSAMPGKPAGKLLLLVFLPVFALLGGLTALTLLQLLRALFAGNLLIRLAWLGFIAACTVFAFRKFRVIWKDPALEPLEGAGMLVLAWLTFLTGGAIARINYRSPAALMEERLNVGQKAGTSAETGTEAVAVEPGKTARTVQTKEESDQLIKDANALLREAEQELEDAEETEKRVNRLIKQ